MKTFLEYVAADIINKYGTSLSRTAVVFPNKRASLFMNEHLARLAGRPLWSPAYITISDLFRRHSPLTVGDPIKLICDLHKSFTACTGIDETLDHFYGWGQLLLADFDDIDKNMADAKQVFANLRDLHEYDDISYLTPEQTAMLKRFFASFSDSQDSKLKQKFLELWSHFYDIYQHFRQHLQSQNIAYEGMLYRDVAENPDLSFDYDRYLFVGFNMMQRVERVLCSRLMKDGKARFYWDFDKYYIQQNGQKSNNEAGQYISQYLKEFPNELDTTDADIALQRESASDGYPLPAPRSGESKHHYGLSAFSDAASIACQPSYSAANRRLFGIEKLLQASLYQSAPQPSIRTLSESFVRSVANKAQRREELLPYS